MPFVLALFGAVLLVVGFRGTHREFFELLKNDFTGPHSFQNWVLSILVVGAVGYIPRLKPISDAFLLLILIVLFLSNQGFFSQFQAQIAQPAQSRP
jgi:uncharacterized membrane protein HdeD (DUF308 family)